MPYGIFNSISLAVDDYGKINNSTYAARVLDTEGRVLLEKNFDTNIVAEDKLIHISHNRNILVGKGETYRLEIAAQDVPEESAIIRMAHCIIYIKT